MTKRELSGRITSTFEQELEKLFNAYNFDESDGGRRTFHIDHPLAERGYFGFEWSRTNRDVCGRDSIKTIPATEASEATRQACFKLERETQALLDLIVNNQTAIYNFKKGLK
ncbi:MAG: hypothetical protein WDA09_06695 [Bacteriovoracaceae bacterium]